MFEQQPMKMAAAEAACQDGTSFSVLSWGDVGSSTCEQVIPLIEIPGLLSFLAHGDFTTEIKGVNSLLEQYRSAYGTTVPNKPIYGERAGQDITYVPVMPVTYWGFRIMIGFGALAAFASAVALWLTRRGTVPASTGTMVLALIGILAPLGANAAGWIFTEMGRQPFVVAPNPQAGDGVFMFTAAALSPGVSAGELLFSLITFASVYGVLLVVEVFLLTRFIRAGVPAAMPELVADVENADKDDKSSDDVPLPLPTDCVLSSPPATHWPYCLRI